MKTRLLFVCFFIVLAPGYAQDIPPALEQVAASVMAAPEAFRGEATVLGYDAKGNLVTLRRGTNGMICLADDPQKNGFSVAAYHVDLEPFMARGRALRAEGKTSKEIFEIREAEAKSGVLAMPAKGATLHLLFGPDGKYDPETGKVTQAIYRYVVYVPWATPETTGLPTEPMVKGGPWIMDAGTHRAHIMISPPAETQTAKE